VLLIFKEFVTMRTMTIRR